MGDLYRDQRNPSILTLTMQLNSHPSLIRGPYWGPRISPYLGRYAPIRASAYPVYTVQSIHYAMLYGVIRGDAYIRVGSTTLRHIPVRVYGCPIL